MATRTIAPGGGNYSVAGTWVEVAVPTAADEVVATGASGQLTVDVNSACRSINLTGYVNTLTIPAGVVLSIGDATLPTGSIALKFPLTMTLACPTSGYPGGISFISTAVGVQSVDFNGARAGQVIFNGVGGSWQLISSMNQIWGVGNVTLTNGTFDVNGQTCDWSGLSTSNANIRTLRLGAAIITLHGLFGNAIIDTLTITNLTVDANTAVITMTQENYASNLLWQSGAKNFNGLSVVMKCSGGIITTNCSGMTVANFTVQGIAPPIALPAYTHDRWQVNTGGFVVTGTLTIKGYDSGHRLRMQSNGALRTFTVAGATVTVENVDFQSISFTVAQNFSAVPGGSGNASGNTNITFTPGVTKYFYAPGTGTKRWSYPGYWFLGSGGTGGGTYPPLPQDDVVFDAASFTMAGVTVLTDAPRIGQNITWAGVTNAPTWRFIGLHLNYGDVTLDAAMSLSASKNATFQMFGKGVAATVYNITSAGKTWPLPFTINLLATEFAKLLDDFVGMFSFTSAGGGLDCNNKNVTCTSFNNSSGTLTMGSSTFTLTGTGTVFTGNGTITAGTSLIKINDTSFIQKTFAGAGKTYNNIEFDGAGGVPCVYAITGSNTFNEFKSSRTVAHRFFFTAATTTTATTWTVNGSAGNMITLSSITAAVHTLAKAGGGVVAMDFVIVSRSTASPAATFTAGANSINSGNNTNWAGFGTNAFTWTGAINNNWSNVGNWFGGAVPGVGDVAYFTGAFNIACTLDVAVSVKGINIDTTYTVAITQAATVTVGTEGWVQRNGTYTGGAFTFNLAGDLFIITGTFTPGTGVSTFDGAVDATLTTTGSFLNSNTILNKSVGKILRMLTTWTLSTVGQTLTITSGKLDTNALTLTVNAALTVTDTLMTTGLNVTAGSIALNPATSTLDTSGSTANLPAFATTWGTTFFNLILGANKTFSMLAGATFTINGTLSATGDQITLNAGPGRGQTTLQSTVEGSFWKISIVGSSTVGNAIDVKDCDARPGKWFEAVGSLYYQSNVCKLQGNFRCIEKPRKADMIYR